MNHISRYPIVKSIRHFSRILINLRQDDPHYLDNPEYVLNNEILQSLRHTFILQRISDAPVSESTRSFLYNWFEHQDIEDITLMTYIDFPCPVCGKVHRTKLQYLLEGRGIYCKSCAQRPDRPSDVPHPYFHNLPWSEERYHQAARLRVTRYPEVYRENARKALSARWSNRIE